MTNILDPATRNAFLMMSPNEKSLCRSQVRERSAQVRRRGAMLQHGSIPIRHEPVRTAAALGSENTPKWATDLETALGRRPTLDELDQAIIRGFEHAFGVTLVPGDLTELELERATRLDAWKYTSLAWTLDGRTGERETRWGPDL